MSEHQSIEERLAGAWFTAQTDSAETLIAYVADYLAAADLPIVDRERGIAVIRLDDPPDDADYLAWLAVELHNDGFDPWVVQKVQRIAERCRAARTHPPHRRDIESEEI